MVGKNVNYRLVYYERCRSMSFETRLQLAQNSQGGEVLLALCFDPSTVIVTAIINNPHFTVTHAQLIARHHQTVQGLLALTKKTALMYDEGVRSALLKNPLSSQAVVAKVLAGYNLFALAGTISGHETTARVVDHSREVFQRKMQSSDPAEVVHFIVASGGRSLKELGGATLPQEVINRLCALPQYSEDLVHNLIAFPALPARLIECLLIRPAAKFNKGLKLRLKAHKNCPSELKKN